VNDRYPILISIPHGGMAIPEEVRGKIALSADELAWYCDPDTRGLYDFGDAVAATISTPVSRMVIDLNRPPLPLPPKDPDGIIKLRTIDGREVYCPGQVPDLVLIHRLMLKWYFPYHQSIDELIDRHSIRLGLDCHSMQPRGSREQIDAGKNRPLICLGNFGDARGNPKPGSLATCPAGLITELADSFRQVFPGEGAVALNTPFSGGFIANAHFWRKGIPWIQVEINRSLYDPGMQACGNGEGRQKSIPELRDLLWTIIDRFCKKNLVSPD
jgi:N-formylglutamate deformylase